MPFDANGKHNLPAGYRGVDGETITPSQHNPPLEDISASLSMAILKDGRTSMTGDLKMGTHKITGLVDGVAPTDAATVGQAADAVGDFKDSARDLGDDWLRRDGTIYDAADYPALAALLPPLAAGVVWSALTPPFGSAAANGIAASATRVAVVSGAAVYYTDDLATWTTVALPLSALGTEAISYGGGRFVVFGAVTGTGGYTTFSSDGCVTWSTPVLALQPTLVGKFPFGAGVFTAGTVGSVGSSTAIISTSPTGGVWTQRVGPQSALLKALFADGAGIVVTSNDGYYYTSTDGATFTQLAPSISAAPIETGVRRSGVNILLGDGGVIHTTTNFTAMTARTSGTTSSFFASAVIDPMIVAVGASGVCRWSIDNGGNWDASATGVSVSLQALIPNPFDPTEVLAIGTGTMIKGERTSSTQFQVPDDDTDYGWIRATA